ncbi:MAG: AAA domain-containing protein [Candidatus Thermoplasmatota archaeon]|nr:AAA domain-containing protein [Candidatus Thermoplasmatota archaeon]
MSVREQAKQLFEYISHVLAIDLPVTRDVTAYNSELWWQNDLITCSQCVAREFDTCGADNGEGDGEGTLTQLEPWLSVLKRPIENPPQPPAGIRDWLALVPNPENPPQPKPSIVRREKFSENKTRVEMVREFAARWRAVSPSDRARLVPVPALLFGWVDVTSSENDVKPISEREIEEHFQDDPRRVVAFAEYKDGQWSKWAERVTPLFRANALYDELYALHQRLSVEGDRIEILWGHLLLAWDCGTNARVLHPLFLTPLNLEFDPQRRNIRLVASSSQPTKIDLECLRDLEYPNKDKILDYARKMNEGESPADVWSHVQMKAISGTLTGLLSAEAAEVTNLYTDLVAEKPEVTPCPVIHNAPVIFVRQRARHFWIDDAKKVAAAIDRGEDIPPFIKILAGDSGVSIGDGPTESAPVHLDEDDNELFFPLEYNDQQREIWDKLKNHFGVLVQGPPGTGKSHTIANVISALLARGKRVLVTSQTENALKVLRGMIPEDIRQLCISQLGNDTESKTQLNEAVQAIGRRLADKTSNAPEQRAQRIRQELRALREEQSVLRNQIRDWAEVDSKTIEISGQRITAEQAAKEYAESKDACEWLKDRLDPNTEPPVTDSELTELCGLLKEVSAEDQASSLMYLPEKIEPPETLARYFADLKAATETAAETENERLEWHDALRQADEERLRTAAQVLEEGIRELRELTEEWQRTVLGLIAADPKNGAFWENFLKTCEEHHSTAFEAFQKSQTFDIEVANLPPDVDVDVALAALDGVVQQGRNPKSVLIWPFLHKSAKCLFKAVTADGKPLSIPERLAAAKAYFVHMDRMVKFEKYWRKNLEPVSGPMADDSAPMPVADAGERIKKVGRVVQWAKQHLGKIDEQAQAMGCPASRRVCHCEDTLIALLSILHGQQAVLKQAQISASLVAYEEALRRERKKANAHPLWDDFAGAVARRSACEYEEASRCLHSLLAVKPKSERIKDLKSRIAVVAPLWASELVEYARECGTTAIPTNWRTAWRIRRLGSWLDQLHDRESIESLQKRLERCRRREQGLITRLVHERTWQRQIKNVKPEQHQALATWADAMRKYGKGTGKYAPYWLNVASRAMRVAQGAVPVWVMPLFRVVELFAAEPGIFDVVVVDEASQCDIRALPVLFRGKKVLVIGDPEQISPASVGVPHDKVMEQIRIWLNGVPYPERFFINNSLYTITGTLPYMDRTLLSEHFRCVPEIIGFNNHLCPTYGGNLEPLRQPNPEFRLEPSIRTVFVESGFKNNAGVNEPEAEALVNKLVECCQDPRYSKGGKDGRRRTMGVISLLGDEHAKYISGLIAQRLNETEREERRIICGDAYAFQGDERDVMFLSMVIATNESFNALVKEDARQRFNVATSRARDQVFLFHSVKLSDINNPECVRYKLLSWYQNPPLKRIEAGLEVLKTNADSQFEIDVGEIIIRRGYRVIPQFEPLKDRQYRIDLVAQGQRDRLAIECDGDRWHGQEKWEDDQKRETQLRRAGWNFWRVSSSVFYRDRSAALSSLWEILDDLGIAPENLWEQPKSEPALSPPKESAVVTEIAPPAELKQEKKVAECAKDEFSDRLRPALDRATKRNMDIQTMALAEIAHLIVGFLRQGQHLTRRNLSGKACRVLELHLSGKSQELLERKLQRALQHLVDREIVVIDESGTIRFAFENNVIKQREFNLGENGREEKA